MSTAPAAILKVPDRLQRLAVEFDVEHADIRASQRWSAAEQDRLLPVLRERADEVVQAVHLEVSQEAHKTIDKREAQTDPT